MIRSMLVKIVSWTIVILSSAIIISLLLAVLLAVVKICSDILPR